MFLFDLIFLVALFLLVTGIIQNLFTRRRITRLSSGSDSLRETQEISRSEAALQGMAPAQREQYQDSMTLSVCFARFALQVAYGDGHLTGSEVRSILDFFRGANPSIREHIQDVLQKDLNHPHTIDWEYNLSEARRVLQKPQWSEFPSMIFDGLLHISLADGILQQRELAIIFQIMGQLGWSQARCEAMFRSRSGFGFNPFGNFQARPGQGSSSQQQGGNGYRAGNNQAQAAKGISRAEALQILGLDQDASPEQVKKRYRELVREHHPDKYATMGEEMQKAATRRFQAIQEAYEFINKNQG